MLLGPLGNALCDGFYLFVGKISCWLEEQSCGFGHFVHLAHESGSFVVIPKAHALTLCGRSHIVPSLDEYASELLRGGFGKSAVTSHVVLLFQITSRRGMWNASHTGGMSAH